jgi:hypothetical protein
MEDYIFLKEYLLENYPSQKYSVKAIQRVFNETDKVPAKNILYYGFFSADIVLEGNSGEFMKVKDLHSRIFIFSSLGYSSNVTATFIGYEVVFERVLKPNKEAGGIFTPEFSSVFQ